MVNYFSVEDPSQAVHVVVPVSRLDRVLRRLSKSDYEVGPEPSEEFLLAEGERLSLSFQHNIQCVDENTTTIPLVYFGNLDMEKQFKIKEVNEFLQKQYDSYRGQVHVSRYAVANDKKETRKPKETAECGDPYRMETVASHYISIPKVCY